MSTCSTVTAPRWKKRRIALRAGGTAKAIPTATTATATTRTTAGRSQRRRCRRVAHARPHVRRGRKLELVHRARPVRVPAQSYSSRSRSSARAVRDLTVPCGTPSVSATSCSDSPSEVAQGRRPCAGPPAAPPPPASSVVSLLGREQGRLGGRGRVPRGLRGRRTQRETRAAAGRAASVASLVGDDAQQPRTKRRSLAEAAERAPRLDEAVLRRVLRVARVARDHVRGPEGDALVCVHELLVGVCVTALRAPDQVRFVEWSAHHRPFYTAAALRSSDEDHAVRGKSRRGHGARSLIAAFWCSWSSGGPRTGMLTVVGVRALLSATITGLSGAATRCERVHVRVRETASSATPFAAQAARAGSLRAVRSSRPCADRRCAACAGRTSRRPTGR